MKAVNPTTGQTLVLNEGRWVPDTFDMDRESSFGDRLKSSVRLTNQGQANYLKDIHGKENVNLVGDTIFIKDPNTGKEYQHDKPGFTLNDLADIVPDAVQAGPEIAAGLMTANPWVAGLTGLLGAAGRQVAGEFMPGDSAISPEERGLNLGINTVLPAALQKGSNVLFGVKDAVSPHNLMARSLQKSDATPYAVEGANLSRNTGIDFSPGQVSGSRLGLTMEGLARRHPVSADAVLEMDKRQMNQAVNRLGRIMDNVRAGTDSPITTGSKVRDAFNSALTLARKQRSSQGKADFSAAADISGNKPVMHMGNTVDKIDNLIQQYDVPGGGDATASLVSRLKNVRGELVDQTLDEAGNVIDETPKRLAVSQFQRLMEVYGKAKAGTGQLFKDIDTAQQRKVAGDMFRGLQDDMSAMADSNVVDKQISNALKVARDNWRINSQQIDKMGKTVLGRMFNGKYDPAPEAIADKFLKMYPSEINQVVDIIKKSDPDALQSVRRHLIESMLDSSAPASSQSTAGITFSSSKFNTLFKNKAERLKAVLGSREYADIKDLTKGLQRLSDRAHTDGSPTAPLLMAMEFGRAAVGGAVNMQPKVLLEATGQAFTMRHIAHAMTTPEGRKAIRTLTHSKTWTKGALAASAYLAALAYEVPEQVSSFAIQNKQPDKNRKLEPSEQAR